MTPPIVQVQNTRPFRTTVKSVGSGSPSLIEDVDGLEIQVLDRLTLSLPKTRFNGQQHVLTS